MRSLCFPSSSADISLQMLVVLEFHRLGLWKSSLCKLQLLPAFPPTQPGTAKPQSRCSCYVDSLVLLETRPSLGPTPGPTAGPTPGPLHLLCLFSAMFFSPGSENSNVSPCLNYKVSTSEMSSPVTVAPLCPSCAVTSSITVPTYSVKGSSIC